MNKHDDERELEALSRGLGRYRSIAAPPVLRSRVRAEIMGAPVIPQPSRRVPWAGLLRPLFAALLVVAVLAGAGGAAAAGSLPGDTAFPIKRAVEAVQVALAPTDEERLDVLTEQLDRRLADLEAVVARRPSGLSAALNEYAAALARLEEQLAAVAQRPTTPARDAAMARSTEAAEDHIARLQALETRLPEAAQPGIERAINTQQRIHGPASPETPNASGSPSRPSAGPGSTAPTSRPTIQPERTERPSPTRR